MNESEKSALAAQEAQRQYDEEAPRGGRIGFQIGGVKVTGYFVECSRDASNPETPFAPLPSNPQVTAEWFDPRVGHCTASGLKNVMSGEAAARRNYLVELVAERFTGMLIEKGQSAAMRYGSLTKARALMAYEYHYGVKVVQVGFVAHPDIKWCGASPDGLVGDDGMIEAKCPFNSSIHVETLLASEMPKEHMPQVQGQMWVTGRKWCDFVSFDPRMPKTLRLFVQRIYRDDAYIANMDEMVKGFLLEVAELDERLVKRDSGGAVKGDVRRHKSPA